MKTWIFNSIQIFYWAHYYQTLSNVTLQEYVIIQQKLFVEL